MTKGRERAVKEGLLENETSDQKKPVVQRYRRQLQALETEVQRS